MDMAHDSPFILYVVFFCGLVAYFVLTGQNGREWKKKTSLKLAVDSGSFLTLGVFTFSYFRKFLWHI